MNCEQMQDFLGLYLDGELDVVRIIEFERHRDRCSRCQKLCAQEEELHTVLQSGGLCFDTPTGLEAKVRARLRKARYGQKLNASGLAFSARRWPVLAMLAAALAILSTVPLLTLRHASPVDSVAQQVLSSHIRSLMVDHLTDIASSSQHTVKPWFSGKLDFAPTVKDLEAKGFPLQGGRLDYVDGHAAAALVYLRHRHKINLFSWPSSGADSAPQALVVKGFNLIYWTQSHIAYWAVSDVSAQDLRQFVQDQRY